MMERNVMIGIGAAVVVVIVLIFSMSGGDSDVSSDGSGSSSGGISAYSGDADFVEFGAELVCVRDNYAKGIKDKGSEEQAVARAEYATNIETLMKEYGYDEDDVSAYADKLVEDMDYARAVISRVKVLCSGAAAELESNIAIAEDGMFVKITIDEANDYSDIEYEYAADGYFNSGSRDSTSDLDDIKAVLAEQMGDALADEAMDVAVIVYE